MGRSIEALSQPMLEVKLPDTQTEVFPKPKIRPKKMRDLTFTPRHGKILDEMEDVQKSMSGDVEGFGELYRRYHDKVYRRILSKTGNSADAEDLTQDVFEGALRASQRYQPEGFTYGAWLFRIAHNHVVDYYMDQRKEVALEEVDIRAGDDTDPQSQVEKRSEIEELRGAIQQLKPDQQKVVQMRLQDMGNKEIAQALGKTEGNVKVIHHRAILNLRSMIKI